MTAFPIADQNQIAPSPIVFPHIVDGGGYMTQFILLGAGTYGTGVLGFYGESGVPLRIQPPP